MMVSIYCLNRPDTDEVFYVGQTEGALELRLLQHMTERTNSAKYALIQEFAKNGSKPTILLLETTVSENANECERKWIAHYLNSGYELLNANVLPPSPECLSVTNWLLENDLIVINRLEERAGIPQRSLHKAIKGIRPLPEKYVKPLIKILKQYGYK